ncbi:hypothetical protein FSP39_017908 [Pinctada imbricata]|uniref:C2H2-type domain-containing protein n=1 Tax=Pinctada imbricata TaxID=66713 RepID=A0AA88XMW5_PINIB|nr:hypothetical protein FSP39_017908 [Pinctada imbricata]
MTTRNKSTRKDAKKAVPKVKEEKTCKSETENQLKNVKPKSNKKEAQKNKKKAKCVIKSEEGMLLRKRKKRTTQKILIPTKKKISDCPICLKPMKTPLCLRRHMAQEHVIYSVKIPKSQFLLKSSIHKNLARKFIVFEANENISVRSEFEKDDVEPFKCKICQRKFKYYSMIKRHIGKKHLHISYAVQRRKSYRGLYRSIVEFLDMRKKAFGPKASSRKGGRGSRMRKVPSTKCYICGQSIAEGRGYSNHLMKLHGMSEDEARGVTGYPKFPKRCSCHECQVEFDNLKLLKEHCRMVHGVTDYSYPCSQCDSTYSALANLKSHMRWQHSVSLQKISEYFETLIPCEVEGCDFSCGNMLAMKNHVMKTHRGVEYRCDVCGFTFHVIAMLHKHKFFKHYHKESPLDHFRCETCQRSFSKRYHLRQHLFRHHGIKVGAFKTYKCTFEGCGKECTTSSGLRSHMRRHTKEKTFKCEYCNQLLKTDTTYRKHINKMHLGIRPHLCQICGQTFGEESELKSHIRNLHSSEKEFQCDHCPYATSNKSTLYTHLYMVHKVQAEGDNREIYECPICNFTTILGHRFRTHMNGHKNIREYKCNVCGKEFISSSTLRAHKQWAHSDKKYSCPHCPYQTKTVQKLNEHIRIQHQLKGYKPYSCPYCSFTCATGGNCRKHIKQKHKGQEVRYIRDDSLLGAARVARMSGNTSTVNVVPIQTVASEATQTYQVTDNLQATAEPSVNENNSDRIIQHDVNIQTYTTITNVMDDEAASASANLEQTQSMGHGTNYMIPSHPVYKLVNAPAGIHIDGSYKSHPVQSDVNTAHLTTLHPSLASMHSGLHTQILDASEIPVNENVIVSSVHTPLQPLVSILPNHMQNL